MANASEISRLISATAATCPAAAVAASKESGVPVEALGDLLDAALRAASSNGRLTKIALDGFERRGGDAAAAGIRLAPLIDLYLSATWRLVEAAGEHAKSALALAQVTRAVARATDDAVAALTRGFEAAQHTAIRRDEARRREFIDDLLSGTADASILAAHAAAFGFSLAAPHVVAVAGTERELVDAGPVQARIEREVLARIVAGDAIVTTKEGLLVCVFPATQPDVDGSLLRLLHEAEPGPWRVAVGPVGVDPRGVATSFADATRAVELAGILDLEHGVVNAEALAGHRLLERDSQAFEALTARIRGRLDELRGGADPLFETLDAYFAAGSNTTETARRLHLSPRAVTYRLEAIRRATGLDARRSPDRFTLEVAAIGARTGLS